MKRGRAGDEEEIDERSEKRKKKVEVEKCKSITVVFL